MKKNAMIKNFTLLLFLFATITLNAQNINIPDANFKKALVENTAINTDGDGEISESEAVAFIGAINVYDHDISNLSGIEYFSNIKLLDCRNNQLNNLDLTNNTKITELSCSRNQLTSLDLSKNLAIINLFCDNNQLTNFNISNNTLIEILSCSQSNLKSLDISKNIAITKLHCYNNQLTNLDISNNTMITELNCFGNQLTDLDLKYNPNITSLHCEINQLTILDISNNTKITELWCSNNKLISIDLSKNTEITELVCSNNQLSNLKLTKNTKITELSCYNNQLNNLDLTTNTAITRLSCNDNKLNTISLNVSQLTNLSCNNNVFPLSELLKIKNYYSDLSYTSYKKIFSPIEETIGYEIDYSSEAQIDGKETTFTWYDSNNNILDETVVSKIGNGVYKFTKVGVFHCKTANTTFPDTELTTESITINAGAIINIPDANFKKALVENTTINTDGDSEISESEAVEFTGSIIINHKSIKDLTGIEYFTKITALDCYNNQITDLDLRKNAVLKTLKCFNNQISNIDVSNNTELTELECNNNQIVNLDLSKNTQLEKVFCNNNQINNLNLGTNTVLAELRCDNNQISNLETNNNTSLTFLNCENNKLTNLNIGQNVNLVRLVCYNNQINAIDLNQNTSLSELLCNNNQIKSLDLSKNTALTYLNSSDNQLTILDVSKNTALINMNCDDNNISNLDISNNKSLTELNCTGNQIKILDVTAATSLTILYCGNNKLGTLHISHNQLATLSCNNNRFSFSSLKSIIDNFPKLEYYSGDKIFSPFDEEVSFEIDYSAEKKIDNITTSFTWYETSVGVVNEQYVLETNQPGVFKFLKAGIYYCDMTNSSFENLQLRTENINIYSNDPIDIPDANFKKALVDNTAINIDGDSEITEQEASSFNDEINVNSLNISDLTGIEHFENITKLQCSGNQLTNLDVSNNKELTSLNCASNQLINLDLENNTKLTDLNCFYNDLSSLKLSSNIIDLYCHTNKFPFSELFKIKQKYSDLAYGQSKKLFFEQDNKVGFKVDYSLEVLIDGNNTNFIWYKGFGETTTNEDILEVGSGVFKFLKGGNYYCEMTNASFPGLTLKTNKITIAQPVFINIPDANFKKALVENTEINTDGDDEISESEANTFTGEINIREKGISDLAGIEYFVNLTILNCDFNEITSIDVSQNIALTYLDIGSNLLTTIDVSNNIALIDLDCFGNQLTQLDVSNNVALTELSCHENQITQLDISKNTALTLLSCGRNQLTTLNISNNLDLNGLYCDNNQLNQLDVSQHTALTRLNFERNQISTIDISKNADLIVLGCNNNQLTQLDISLHTALTHLYCANNQFTQLDVSNNVALSLLYCENNQLTQLDLNNNSAITSLSCFNNKIPFSELLKIKNHYSDLYYTSAKKIFSTMEEASGFELDYSLEALINGIETVFTWYDFNDNLVDESIVSTTGNGMYQFLKQGMYYCKMTNGTFPSAELRTENISINNNKAIDIPDTNFKNALIENTLVNIDGNNEITEYEAMIYKSELDVSGKEIGNLMGIEYFINLKVLQCQDNKLGSLYIENNNELEELNCSGNQLQDINLPSKLKSINCSSNLLIIFDISKCTELTDLNCSANEIDDLDIRSNKKLMNLNCSYNDLNELSLTESNSQLIKLNIDQNHLSLSELNKIKAINPVLVEIEKYSPDYLSRQFDVFKELVEELANEIDLTAEALFNEKETTFKWTKDYGMTAIDESTFEVVKPGIFKFLKTGIYHCEMTNEEFPDIVVTTSEVKIIRHTQEITFEDIPDPVRAKDVLELSATATSGLEVTFELVSGDASIDGKTITFNKEGTVELKAIQAGNDEYKPTEATIEITVDIATGINDVLKSSIQVYPNPVITDLNITFEMNEDRMIYIYDLKGQIKHQQKSFSNSEQLNISNFKSGMYILKIQSESGAVSYKILKQ